MYIAKSDTWTFQCQVHVCVLEKIMTSYVMPSVLNGKFSCSDKMYVTSALFRHMIRWESHRICDWVGSKIFYNSRRVVLQLQLIYEIGTFPIKSMFKVVNLNLQFSFRMNRIFQQNRSGYVIPFVIEWTVPCFMWWRLFCGRILVVLNVFQVPSPTILPSQGMRNKYLKRAGKVKFL